MVDSYGSEAASNERNRVPHPKSYCRIAKIQVVTSHRPSGADQTNLTPMTAVIYGEIKLTREAVVAWNGEAVIQAGRMISTLPPKKHHAT